MFHLFPKSACPKLAKAAIAMLFVLQLTMLFSLFFAIRPHPPRIFPIAGMAPFLSASFAVLIAAYILGPLESRAGQIFALLAMLMALISFGPQKYFDPQWPTIWPAVVAAQGAVVILAVQLIAWLKGGRPRTTSSTHSEQEA